MNVSLTTKAMSSLVAVFLVLCASSLEAQESATQVNVLNYRKFGLYFGGPGVYFFGARLL